MAILIGEFVLVRKHAVATIDIVPGERLWGVLDKPFTHLWFIWVRRIKPGFWQAVGGGVTAVSTSNIWAVGQFYNSSNVYQTLIENWNGINWNIASSPGVGPNGDWRSETW